MNDKQQLAAIGEQLTAIGERMGVQVQPMCMAKRIDELEAQLEKLTNRLVWRNTGSPNGLRRFMTQKQYKAQAPGIQKWYEPIRYEVPEGWQLVPVTVTPEMFNASMKWDFWPIRPSNFQGLYDAMLAAAPSLDSAK